MKIKTEMSIDFVEYSGSLSQAQGAEIVDTLLTTMGSYEFSQEVFRLVGEHLIASVEDRLAPADAKLSIDELVTEFVRRFREALHG